MVYFEVWSSQTSPECSRGLLKIVLPFSSSPSPKKSAQLTFSQLLDKFKNTDSLKLEQPTGWRSRHQEQNDRVKELFTVHPDALVRDASKQQHWAWDGLEDRSFASMLISREPLGDREELFDPVDLVLCPTSIFPLLFRIQGTSVLEPGK